MKNVNDDGAFMAAQFDMQSSGGFIIIPTYRPRLRLANITETRNVRAFRSSR